MLILERLVRWRGGIVVGAYIICWSRGGFNSGMCEGSFGLVY